MMYPGRGERKGTPYPQNLMSKFLFQLLSIEGLRFDIEGPEEWIFLSLLPDAVLFLGAVDRQQAQLQPKCFLLRKSVRK